MLVSVPANSQDGTFASNERTNAVPHRVLGRFAVATLVVLAFAVSLIATPSLIGAQQSLPNAERDQIIGVMKEYLLDNPEFMLEVLNRLQDYQRGQATARRQQVIAEYRDALHHDPDSVVGGNPNGDVTIVEFFDYQCPYCRKSFQSIQAVLKKDPGIRFVYKEFPILGPQSVFASRAAIAARAQGRYAPFHDALMSSKGTLDEATVLQIAAEVGLNTRRLRSDMMAPAVTGVIERNQALARVLEINGTPGFVIGDRIIAGAMDLKAIEQAVASARAD